MTRFKWKSKQARSFAINAAIQTFRSSVEANKEWIKSATCEQKREMLLDACRSVIESEKYYGEFANNSHITTKNFEQFVADVKATMKAQIKIQKYIYEKGVDSK